HAALQMLGDECAAVTTEFENVPANSVEYLEQFCKVRPGAQALHIAQDRIREKSWLQELGLPTALFVPVYESSDLDDAFEQLTAPLLMKTASMGYDGKGQVRVNDPGEAHAAFTSLGENPCVLEEMVELECEVSVILARSINGHAEIYPVGENRHVNGILDTTIVPAAINEGLRNEATGMARRMADAMDYCGVLAVEFFCARNNELLVNEIATRPHNSGHYTVDACITSQFKQQVRAMCGLPPGDASLHTPVVMTNLLGDIWADGEPDWGVILGEPKACLHLYGQREARAGRKMGHFNVLAETTDAALERVAGIRKTLGF
ncbi:MAG: 5-(carboxyamino)imidazole ribonucleotide synthase, partial [Gammaproteobacteria bacterium]|nr:5-(carboxyamino)imidazole ribonucleotide synthase [Gammaproteobacteria bacterium]